MQELALPLLSLVLDPAHSGWVIGSYAQSVQQHFLPPREDSQEGITIFNQIYIGSLGKKRWFLICGDVPIGFT